MNFPISETELRLMLRTGEDTFTQFKTEVKNAESLAEEMVAFANGKGGYLLIGVAEDAQGNGKAIGVENLKSLNNHISNTASENCIPALFPQSQTLLIDDKPIAVIYIEEGNQKPYRTKSGKYLMRVGADKRSVSQEELSRMFQASGTFHIEELAIRDASIESELDRIKLFEYFEGQHEGKSVSEHLAESGQSLETFLNNLGIAQKGQLNLIGLLFFGKNPQRFRPVLEVKCVSFFGNELGDTSYRSSTDIGGNLEQQFEQSLAFITSNLHKQQPQGAGFNSPGILEISKIALEEALVNALVHRDYGKTSPVRVFVFQNRVEIVSPGSLPNHLTIEQIKNGNAVPRNPILLSYAVKLMPYRGLGSGISRILKEHPKTEFINDSEGQQFKVIMLRP
ncbi:MAG: putative DNA binding domain-containing protein [Spirosomataceae bacterium]